MAVAEPTLAALGNPIVRYVLATRPPFLAASAVPVVLGLAAAGFGGADLNALSALMTLLGALIVHAAINVLNDYYDALNGTDEINVERVYPFTGGSRFIQNGVLTLRETGRYGLALLALGALIGLMLLPAGGLGLLQLGAVGLLIGWAYSAPPLRLNSRGFGELCVALGFGVLIPVGADCVQTGGLSLLPVVAGIPYGLLVANLLYINQFPDRRADEASGKRHWVVRLGVERGRWGYVAIAALSYLSLILAVTWGALPPAALLGLLAAAFSIPAAMQLLHHAAEPARLVPAIRLTILAALSQGLLMALGLWWGV